MKKIFFFSFFLFFITSTLHGKNVVFEIRKSIETTNDSPLMINGVNFVHVNGIGIPFYQTAVSTLSFTSQGQIDSKKLQLGGNDIVFSVTIQNNAKSIGNRYYSLYIQTPANSSFKKIINLTIASGENSNQASATIQIDLHDIDPELAEVREQEKKVTLEKTQKEYNDSFRRMVEERYRKEKDTKEMLPESEQSFLDSIRVCFSAGTMIHTPHGLKDIEELRQGDQVISYDFSSSQTVVAEIETINKRDVPQIFFIETEDFEKIETTEEHPFWVNENGGRWLMASELSPFDSQLFRIDKKWVEVTEVLSLSKEQPTTVFNLQIRKYHNYFVSDAGYLVHNCDLFSMHKIEIFAAEASDIFTKLGIGAGAGCAIAGITCAGTAVTPGGQIATPGACFLASGLCTAAAESFATALSAEAMGQYAKMQSDEINSVKKNSNFIKGDESKNFSSKSDAFNSAKKDLGIPRAQQPTKVDHVKMTDLHGQTQLGKGGKPIITREYHYTRSDGSKVVVQEHSLGHKFDQGGKGDQGPHYNTRPFDPKTGKGARNNKVPGTQEHYSY